MTKTDMHNVILDCAYVFILQYFLNESEYIPKCELVFLGIFFCPVPFKIFVRILQVFKWAWSRKDCGK